MSVDAWITNTASQEEAERNAMTRSYLAAKTRLSNARVALHDAIAEFESAIHEVEHTQQRLDEYLMAHPATGGGD